MARILNKFIKGIDSSKISIGNISNFEDFGVGMWQTYADAAAAIPVDGTGGTPNVTFTRITTNPLNGSASARLSKDAANRQGQGTSVLIEVPEYLRGNPVKYSLSYKASANFGFGNPFNLAASPSDVMVYAYDVTNAVLITPYPNALSGGNFAEGAFQIPSNCTQVRLILHIATTSALAWDLDVDNVELSLAENEYTSADSDWVSYTPTFTNLGTPTGVFFRYRKNGPNIEIEGKWTNGTVGAGEARVSLPPGLFTQNEGTIRSCGGLARNDNGSLTDAIGYSYICLFEPNVGYITFGRRSTGAAAFTKVTGTLLNNTVEYSLNATVPIQGWTSGTAHPASLGLNAQAIAVARKTSTQALTANVTNIAYTTIEKDTTGSWDGSIYTVRVPGDYYVQASYSDSASNSWIANAFVNGVTTNKSFNITNGQIGSGIVLLQNLRYGDQISIRANASFTANNTGSISFVRLGSEAQPYAPRIAYIKDVKASGTAGGTATAGSYQTRVLNTLEGDTSFVSLVSNQFTLQPGTYHIEADPQALLVGTNKAKLRNITDSTDTLIGKSSNASATAAIDSHSNIIGTFSISSPKVFEIQHRVQATRATDGFGIASSFGDSEVYTQVKITKVL